MHDVYVRKKYSSKYRVCHIRRRIKNSSMHDMYIYVHNYKRSRDARAGAGRAYGSRAMGARAPAWDVGLGSGGHVLART